MKTTWDNFKTIKAAKRQATANKKRGNTWTHVRELNIATVGARFVLQTEADKQTVWSA